MDDNYAIIKSIDEPTRFKDHINGYTGSALCDIDFLEASFLTIGSNALTVKSFDKFNGFAVPTADSLYGGDILFASHGTPYMDALPLRSCENLHTYAGLSTDLFYGANKSDFLHVANDYAALTLNRFDNLHAYAGPSTDLLYDTNKSDFLHVANDYAALTLDRFDNLHAYAGPSTDLIYGANELDFLHVANDDTLTLNRFDNLHAYAVPSAILRYNAIKTDPSYPAIGRDSSTLYNHNYRLIEPCSSLASNGMIFRNMDFFLTGINSEFRSNHIYGKHFLKGLDADLYNFSFYTHSQVNRVLFEDKWLEIIGSLKSKPGHVGFEYTVDEKRPQIIIYMVFNDSINGETINIGDHITYISTK